MINLFKIFGNICLLTIMSFTFIACENPTNDEVSTVWETASQRVTKITFSGAVQRVVVDFHDLTDNDIFLVKVNTSDLVVNAANTGRVMNVSPYLSEVLPHTLQAHNISDNELPRIGRPFNEAHLFPLPMPVVREAPLRTRSVFVPPVVNDRRNFWVETVVGNLTFISREAVLEATGTHSNIWVMGNSISRPQAQALAKNFDIIYPAATEILGFEYGGRPGHPNPGGRDGDPKIQILVYEIGSNVAGYFWEKDFYTDAQLLPGWRSNNAEIFYIDASTVISSPDFIISTLIHELQHMINFNVKRVERRLSSPAWYNEMLSMMAEDIIAGFLTALPPTNSGHVIQQRIPLFLSDYIDEGVTEWGQQLISYSTKYAFGAYLLRNHGGADLLRRILANNAVGIPSITAALNEIRPGLTFNEALIRYGESLVFANPVPSGVMTFDRTVETTINGKNYTAFGFNIWDMQRRGSSAKGPIIHDLTQRNMRPHSVSLHSADAWQNKSGSYSITLQRPRDPNIVFILMVK